MAAITQILVALTLPYPAATDTTALELYAGGNLQLYGGGNLDLYGDYLQLYVGGNLDLYGGGSLVLYSGAGNEIPAGVLLLNGVPVLEPGGDFLLV